MNYVVDIFFKIKFFKKKLVFNIERAMGPLTPYFIKLPLVKTRVGHFKQCVNGGILGSVFNLIFI